MTRYIKTACLIVVVAIALVSAVFFSYKCIRQATADAAPEETTEMTEATETVPPETEPTTVPTEETIPEETTATEETVPVETEAPKVTIDAVPHYHQSEYPDIRYGNGTIATSGSHYKRLEKVSDLMQIPWKRALNVNEALKAVREGKIAIALMGSRSVFPGGNHFIVLTGVTEDGKIWVLDPDDRDYSAWGVGELLENGFPDGKLIAGYEGAWIYDKTQMPEEPFIYEPEPAPEESRYPGLELTDAEIKLMADLIFMEAQSEPFEGQQAVAEVIFNRLKSGNFQSSINSIIYAKDQFAAVKNLYLAKPTDTQYKAIERALNGPYVLPEDVVFYAKFAVNKKIWGTIGSHIFCYSY